MKGGFTLIFHKFHPFFTELNSEQKEAKAKILQHTVTLLAGSAGSGKTFLACQIALEKLFMKEAELMRDRLSLLQSVDPYTGRYFSQKWIQQNVLRLTDDQIKEMQDQIDQEKEQGLGLPVEVTNSVAQQQMAGDIQTQQQLQVAQGQAEIQQDMEPQQPQQQATKSNSSSDKKKQTSSRADLSLENNTFTKLKRIKTQFLNYKIKLRKVN